MLISVKDLINQALELYQKNYKIFLRYVLLLFIPTGITAVAATLLGKLLTVIAVLGFSVPLLIYLLVIILASLANVWVSICFIKVVKNSLVNGPAIEIKDNLQTNSHLILPTILVSILTFLILLGGFFLLIIPAIIFYIWIRFAKIAVILDHEKPTEALKISKRLVAKRWWPVCWRLLGPGIVFTLMLFFAQWLLGMPMEVILNNFNFGNTTLVIAIIIYTLITTFTSLLFMPLYNAVLIILYENLKATPNTTSHLEPPQK